MMYNNSISLNGLGCGCQKPNDPLTALRGLSGVTFPDGIVGLYGRSKKDIIFYTSPGGPSRYTRKINKYGYAFIKIKGLNQAKTWAMVYEPVTGLDLYFPISTNPDFADKNNYAQNFEGNGTARGPSTTEELAEARKMGENAAVKANPMAAAGSLAVDALDKVVDVAANIGSGLLSTLKWAAILGLVVGVGYITYPMWKPKVKE